MVTHVEPEPHDDDDADPQVDATLLVMGVAERVADEARRNPLRTLGIAFGAGFVLGGGLPRFVVRMAAMAALRSAAAAALTSDTAAALAQQLLTRARGSGTATPARGSNGRSRYQA